MVYERSHDPLVDALPWRRNQHANKALHAPPSPHLTPAHRARLYAIIGLQQARHRQNVSLKLRIKGPRQPITLIMTDDRDTESGTRIPGKNTPAVGMQRVEQRPIPRIIVPHDKLSITR